MRLATARAHTIRVAGAIATAVGLAVRPLPGIAAAVLAVWGVYLLAGTGWAMLAAAAVLFAIDWRLSR